MAAMHPRIARIPFSRNRLATLIAALPLVALAQDPPTLPEVQVREKAVDERPDGPVTGYRATRSSTFTRTDTPLKEVPASVSVVPAQLVRDASLMSLGELFRYVPGATTHQGEGNRDQVVIRGTSTTADFYVNGVRDDAQVFRDLYNVERVEVLKGPGGMAFGRGGAGGVVNRVTKRPVFAPLGEASLLGGSYGQARATVDLGDKVSDAAWRVNAMAERAGSFRDGVDLRRWGANPVATFVVGGNTLVTLDVERQDDRRTADRGIPSQGGKPFATARSTFFGNADQSEAHSRHGAAAAVVDADLGGGWQLRDTLRFTRYDKYYRNVYPGSAVSAAGTLAISAYDNRNQRDNVFNQLDLTRTFATGPLKHTLLVGVELGSQESDNLRNTGFFGDAGTATSAVVSAADAVASATRFGQSGTDANNRVKGKVAAAYVQDQVALSSQWKVLAGIRFDRFAVDFDDRRVLAAATDLSRTDREVSPRAGLIWRPTAASTYYASYSYAFLPSGEQLSLAATIADLAPEKSVNYEVGARWDLRPGLTLSAAIFRTERRDVRVADPANLGQFLRSGAQRAEGVEVGVQGDVTAWWQVYGGYSHLDARVTRAVTTGTAATAASIVPAGNRLALSPENALSLWNRLDLGAGWGAGLGVIRQGESFTSIGNAVRLPGYTRIDGAVYYAFPGGRSRIALNVENLGDTEYYPTADGDNNISPGGPRALRVTYTHRF